MKTLSLMGAILVAALCSAPVHADSGAGPNADSKPFTYDIGVRLFGADIGVGYTGITLIPGVQTTFWIYGGGGYQSRHYYRDASGNLLSPGEIASNGGALANADPSFWRIEGAWRLGIAQGLLWNPRASANLLEAFLFYRGRYDVNRPPSGGLLTLPSLDVLPDRDSSFLNTLQVGLGWNDMLKDKSRGTSDGLAAEASAEWGPRQGDADFIRFNANLQWLHPIFEADPAPPLGIISVSIGDNLTGDYAIGLNGSRVPLSIRQSFGGRDQTQGLGDQVRGVDEGAYDTNLKAANNLEVRANLLSIPAPSFLPGFVKEIAPQGVVGVLGYFDSGVYDQVGEPGISSPQSGLVAATGGGVYGIVPGVGGLVLYVQYRLDHPNADGGHLSFSFDFSWKF